MQEHTNKHLFYIGRKGGCLLVKHYKIVDDKVIGYFGNHRIFKIKKEYFFINTVKFTPEYIEITEPVRNFLLNSGIPLIEENGKTKIKDVVYEGIRYDKFSGIYSQWKVVPFYISNKMFFKLENSGKEFFITLERLQKCFRGS